MASAAEIRSPGLNFNIFCKVKKFACLVEPMNGILFLKKNVGGCCVKTPFLEGQIVFN